LHLRATCNGHTKAVSRVRFAPDSQQLLASASADQSLRLWRLPDGAAVHAKGGGSKRSPEQQQQQQHQHQQQPAAAKQQQTMRHAAGINDVAWNPAGSYLATASDDLTACIWDAESGRCLSTLAGHTNYVFCCQFNPAGNMLVRERLSSDAGAAQGRGSRGGSEQPARACTTVLTPVGVPRGPPVLCLQATGSFDETVRFWDVRSGRCLRELPAHSDPVTGGRARACLRVPVFVLTRAWRVVHVLPPHVAALFPRSLP
jgi:COMPASS component SWD3